MVNRHRDADRPPAADDRPPRPRASDRDRATRDARPGPVAARSVHVHRAPGSGGRSRVAAAGIRDARAIGSVRSDDVGRRAAGPMDVRRAPRPAVARHRRARPAARDRRRPAARSSPRPSAPRPARSDRPWRPVRAATDPARRRADSHHARPADRHGGRARSVPAPAPREPRVRVTWGSRSRYFRRCPIESWTRRAGTEFGPRHAPAAAPIPGEPSIRQTVRDWSLTYLDLVGLNRTTP